MDHQLDPKINKPNQNKGLSQSTESSNQTRLMLKMIKIVQIHLTSLNYQPILTDKRTIDCSFSLKLRIGAIRAFKLRPNRTERWTA